MPRLITPANHRPQSARTTVLLIAFACGLASAAQALADGDRAASALEGGVDASIRPGDDFFSYANGAWLKATEIPAGKGLWGARSEIAQRTQQQVAELLDDANAAPAGSDARKVADFHAAYLNEAAIEARGIAPLKPMLDRIDRIRDKAGLTRLLGSELRADVDPMNLGVYNSSHILGLAVQAGSHGETHHLAYLLQGGLGLPDREHYLGADARMQALRDQYQLAIGHTLARLGVQGAGIAAMVAASRAGAVLALETAIARSHATAEASADDGNADTLWTRADFAHEAPGMDWTAFFAAAGLAKQQTFVAWQPTALKGAAALVASQPLQVWKDYLRVRVIGRYAEVLPRAFSVEAATPHGATASPDPSGLREQRASDATLSATSYAVGKMYTERHFAPEHKARVQAIVANVVAAFTRRVEAAAWMSPATQAMALAKLRNLYFGVGYPERWQDPSSLLIDPADAVGNLQRVAQHRYSQALARLTQPADKTVWGIAPQWPGAVLLFHQNAYNFAAALLQVPKFDPSASDAANYGAIGAIVGHEVSHFVDTLGADYEADGRRRRWWTDDDRVRYQAATEALVRQFSGYRPFPDVAIDGQRGLTENLADLGGLVAAFDAYRRTLGSDVNDKEYVRQQDRQFFIGFARSWRVKYRDDALRAQAASDHAPENYRVSTVRNIDAWYDAFDVKPGQRLYLEPSARVRIW
jgi:predicted metalloendopeptidase